MRDARVVAYLVDICCLGHCWTRAV